MPKTKLKKDSKQISFYLNESLLPPVKEFGGLTAFLNIAIQTCYPGIYLYSLREIMAKINQQITLLENWRDNGPVSNEGEIDEYHLQLLEVYKHLFFSLKDSKLLRSNRTSK